jgi:hypothetical protein
MQVVTLFGYSAQLFDEFSMGILVGFFENEPIANGCLAKKPHTGDFNRELAYEPLQVEIRRVIAPWHAGPRDILRYRTCLSGVAQMPSCKTSRDLLA